MKLREVSREVELRAGIGRISQLLILFLIFTNLILASTVLTKRDITRTVIVPAMLHKQVWLEDNNFSAEYLEEMGYFLSMVNLNIDPSNVDYNQSLFLKYVSSRSYGPLKIQADAVAARIKDQQESYTFKVTSITPDVPNKRVAVIGLKEATLGATKMGVEQVAYVISFEYENTTVRLLDMYETTPEKPFEKKVIEESVNG